MPIDRIVMDTFLDGSHGYHAVLGVHVPWTEFYGDFLASHGGGFRRYWTKERTKAVLTGMGYPVGRGPANRMIVGNVSHYPTRRRWVRTGPNTIRLEKRE